jgi:Flp pilus assembly protein TadD
MLEAMSHDTEVLRRLELNGAEDASTLNHRGVTLRRLNRMDEAIVCYRRAIALQPDLAEAHHNLGNALADQNQLDDAVLCYRRAIALRPDWSEAHNHLGTVLLAQGNAQQALACHRTALALRAGDPRTLCYLGDALAYQGALDAAIDSYRQSLSIDPTDHETHNNLGNALLDARRLDEAIACYRQALSLRPDLLAIRSNLSKALLTQGNLLEGFAEQESRWCVAANPTGALPPDVWDGRDVRGKTVLIHTEQGFGDTIQFIRYAPLLAARGARVVIECQPQLQRLLQAMPGVDGVLGRGQQLPPFDFRALLMSLPANFKTTLETIPAQVPYLRAPNELTQRWRQRLAEDRQCLKVGLAWAGNPRQKNDHNRSMQLSMLAPLARVPGARFYSLQTGDAARQLNECGGALRLVDCAPELFDFAQTAALIENLDLVISVDTAVAHLAGALGRPVWTLLAFAADWRWLLHRADNPWYPTMRLFRQRSWGDWTPVVERVLTELGAKSPRR